MANVMITSIKRSRKKGWGDLAQQLRALTFILPTICIWECGPFLLRVIWLICTVERERVDGNRQECPTAKTSAEASTLCK